jgi:hypothetical protein
MLTDVRQKLTHCPEKHLADHRIEARMRRVHCEAALDSGTRTKRGAELLQSRE